MAGDSSKEVVSGVVEDGELVDDVSGGNSFGGCVIVPGDQI